jgi:O-antigen/teichoic acid export membrane protein
MLKRIKDKLYNSRFKGLFATDGTLSQKTARSGVWVMGSFGFSKILGFIQTIILARLLLPEDFGLMGVCYIAIAAMAVFTETGFNQALIQRKDYNDDVLNTAWVIAVLRGLILFTLLFTLAPVISRFYDNAQIASILRVIAFSFLLSGFNNIGLILFNKELNFKKKVVYDQLGAILGIAATISLAFWLRNVWALVLGNVFGGVIGTVLSYWAHPFRPKFKFKVDIAKELFHFGKHVFFVGIAMFIITQGDDALVGKILGMSALGFYLLAYKLSNLPVTSITRVTSSISYPAYAKVQDDKVRLQRGYLKVLKGTSFLVILASFLLFVLAPEFIQVVYGQKWLPMVPAVMVMCFLGYFRGISATMGPVFQGLGKPYILSKIKLSELILMLIIIYPLTLKFGIVGAAITGTLVYFLSFILHYYYLTGLIKGVGYKVAKIISLQTICAFLAGCVVIIMKKYLFVSSNFISLIILAAIGICIYLLANLFIDKSIIENCREIIDFVKN